MIGTPGRDLDERRVEDAARELAVCAGPPDLNLDLLDEDEHEAWRVAARRTVRAYRGWSADLAEA